MASAVGEGRLSVRGRELSGEWQHPTPARFPQRRRGRITTQSLNGQPKRARLTLRESAGQVIFPT